MKAGVNVALGTDGVASNNNLNMLGEMQTMALLHKGIAQDPTLLSPGEAIDIATRAGAVSQGRPDCGQIRRGNRADLVLLDTSAPHWHPVHDLLNNLVYASDGSDVCMTMVDGRVLYENGEFPQMDMERVYREVESSRLRILGELGN